MQYLIFGNTFDPGKAEIMARLVGVFSEHGAGYALEPGFFGFLKEHSRLNLSDEQLMKGDVAGDCIAVSIGGDGTFLRTAKSATRLSIPLIGVNMGQMGFLTDIEPSTLGNALESIANGDYRIEERTQLKLEVKGREEPTSCIALNEIAVMKMDISSMITIKVSVNGQFLCNYQCDGLIVATSTGSTAYSLSVGGPIIMPQSKSMVITSVAPHNLNIRPIVLCDDCTVEMEVRSRNNQFLVSADGASMACGDGDRLTVSKAGESLKVVKLNSHPMFENLRSKLMLGIDTRGSLQASPL